MRKYYALEQSENEASITIYGDITSWPWLESDVCAYRLSKQIDAIEAETIHVYINSYGGEVSEGLAIYNALRRHRAKVKTYCDGFACSAASIVFMAGEERLMGEASLLMIHNAWTNASGNAAELRKVADDLDTISEAAANAYRGAVNLDDAVLAKLLDHETWISPQDAVAMGFATGISSQEETKMPAASLRSRVMERLQKPWERVSAALDAKRVAKELLDALSTEVTKPDQDHQPIKLMDALMRKGGAYEK